MGGITWLIVGRTLTLEVRLNRATDRLTSDDRTALLVTILLVAAIFHFTDNSWRAHIYFYILCLQFFDDGTVKLFKFISICSRTKR